MLGFNQDEYLTSAREIIAARKQALGNILPIALSVPVPWYIYGTIKTKETPHDANPA